jgi:uncharacterized YigZ family protein
MSKYLTIRNEATGEFKDKGSKFLAYAYPIDNEEDTHIYIEQLHKVHPKARHWCYAWRLGLDKNNYRANDDGEPSGTAGRPILGQIDSFGLTNVLVVVVRYFGGTLLGTSGLIQAYRESAKQALELAPKVEKVVSKTIVFRCDYTLMPDLMNALKKLALEITDKTFEDNAIIQVAIPVDEIEDNWLKIKSLILKKDIEQAKLVENIGGIKIEYV